jgi:hypothetical protein
MEVTQTISSHGRVINSEFHHYFVHELEYSTAESDMGIVSDRYGLIGEFRCLVSLVLVPLLVALLVFPNVYSDTQTDYRSVPTRIPSSL